MRNFLFFLGIAIMEFIYLVGVVIGVTIFCVFKLFNVFLSLGFNVIAMRCGVCCIGGIVSFRLILYSLLSWFRSLLKIFGNFDMSFFLVIGECGVFIVKIEVFLVSGLRIKLLFLYWMMFIVKYDLMLRIGRRLALSIKR